MPPDVPGFLVVPFSTVCVEYGRNDGLTPSSLGHKRHCGFCLSGSLALGKAAAMLREKT